MSVPSPEPPTELREYSREEFKEELVKEPTEFLSFVYDLNRMPSFKDMCVELGHWGSMKRKVPVVFNTSSKVVAKGISLDMDFVKKCERALRDPDMPHFHDSDCKDRLIEIGVAVVLRNVEKTDEEALQILDLTMDLRDKSDQAINCEDFQCKWYAAGCNIPARTGFQFSENEWSKDMTRLRVELKVRVDYKRHGFSPLTFPVKNHAGSNSGQILLSTSFSDVIIKCGDEDIPAHKSILATASPVFSTMLSTDMKEKQENVIVMKDMSPEVCKLMLRFLYTGALEVTKKEVEKDDSKEPKLNNAFLVQDVHATADMYELLELKEVCEIKLIEMIDLNNVVDLYAHTLVHQATKLNQVAYNFISMNRKAIFEKYTLQDIVNVCPQIIPKLIGV